MLLRLSALGGLADGDAPRLGQAPAQVLRDLRENLLRLRAAVVADLADAHRGVAGALGAAPRGCRQRENAAVPVRRHLAEGVHGALADFFRAVLRQGDDLGDKELAELAVGDVCDDERVERGVDKVRRDLRRPLLVEQGEDGLDGLEDKVEALRPDVWVGLCKPLQILHLHVGERDGKQQREHALDLGVLKDVQLGDGEQDTKRRQAVAHFLVRGLLAVGGEPARLALLLERQRVRDEEDDVGEDVEALGGIQPYQVVEHVVSGFLSVVLLEELQAARTRVLKVEPREQLWVCLRGGREEVECRRERLRVF